MTQIILVGGFLGAGKTTLLHQAARKITAAGKKVGLITNDQTTDLVDTFLLSDAGLSTQEVAGSCFCCNFPGFFQAVEHLRQGGAEVIVAEPVGSCTDLVATIVQPLKKFHADDVSVARFTVLLDPVLLAEALGLKKTSLEADGVYIVLKQMEEADILAINKTDTLDETTLRTLTAEVEKRFAGKPVILLSGLHDTGVDTWMETVVAPEPVGTTHIEVDYDRYAHGEAILGWMNCSATLQWKTAPAPAPYLEKLMSAIGERLREEKVAVGHIKAVLYEDTCCAMANLTHLDAAPSVRTRNVAARESLLVLNARIQTSPQRLENLVLEAFTGPCAALAEVSIRQLQCFQPGRPNPTFRVAGEEYI